MQSIYRRDFLSSVAGFAGAGLLNNTISSALAAVPAGADSSAQMKFGLVTYMWGADWDLPTLLANCEKAGAMGVELRTEHKHGVDPEISAEKRREVKQRFADSPVKLVGVGSNQAFHYPDQAQLRASIERAKAFIKLSHDIGGSGAKVKPNDLPKDVPQEKTIEQIGKSLNELGAYAADLGQQVRLEWSAADQSHAGHVAAYLDGRLALWVEGYAGGASPAGVKLLRAPEQVAP